MTPQQYFARWLLLVVLGLTAFSFDGVWGLTIAAWIAYAVVSLAGG